MKKFKKIILIVWAVAIAVIIIAGTFVYQAWGRAKICGWKLSHVSGRGAYMPNPASAFCSCMGGKLQIVETPQGQQGVCSIGSKTYDEWQYFRSMSR